MILVKNSIGPSKIHGIGLFADQFIPKGTPVWKFQPGFDLKFSEEQLQKLSDPAKEQCLKYCYRNKKTGMYILCFDDTRFQNHSDQPTCIDQSVPEDDEGIDVAARDINVGEELTMDYSKYDSDFQDKLSHS